MKNRYRYAAVVLISTSLAGCGTIANGGTQSISVASTPVGATVTANGLDLGSTPLLAELSRKETQLLVIELEGYNPQEMYLTRSVSGWVWGNIVFGGIIGLVVDVNTGGMYKLTPEQVSTTLTKGVARADTNQDTLQVMAVLEADPTWEKVGELEQL